MRILISNDDGIGSNGLKVLAERLALSNEVLVVAPSENQSACSHSLSICKKIKLTEYFGIKRCRAYSITGTAADCVKFAKLVFKDFNADIVIAGINKGHNLGSDILYSGTVSIACEAAFFGNVSFAFSAFSHGDSNFELYADYAEKIIKKLLPISVSGDIWNVNFPNELITGVKGAKITPLGKQIYSDRYEIDDDGNYTLVGSLLDHDENDDDCDIETIKKGFISVTPLVFNKTNYKKIKEVNKRCMTLL